MKHFETILYETPADHVARIVLNRPETRNSQDTKMLYELNDAFDIAAQDDSIKVIILAANGPHFSSGHDLREQDSYQKMADFRTVGTWCGFTCAGAEAQMAREGNLSRVLRTLAQYPQTDDCSGSWQSRCRRTHAYLAV